MKEQFKEILISDKDTLKLFFDNFEIEKSIGNILKQTEYLLKIYYQSKTFVEHLEKSKIL